MNLAIPKWSSHLWRAARGCVLSPILGNIYIYQNHHSMFHHQQREACAIVFTATYNVVKTYESCCNTDHLKFQSLWQSALLVPS